MGISLKTHKLLWGRSGNRCAFQVCRNELIADETETDDESVIGDEAHIVARKEDGPRGDNPLPLEERDKYDNLILLCRIHHKLIDDQPNFYTVDMLTAWKKSHELWVKESLNFDESIVKEELTYATYIDTVFKTIELENWNAWTSSLLSHGQPKIHKNLLDRLGKVPDYIVSRFWTGLYEELEISIMNLKNVLNDLLRVFHEHTEKKSYSDSDEEDYMVFTERFYKSNTWNENYHEDLDEYKYHVDLVEDLTLELTRAANFVIENIRKTISPNFREEEGKLLITMGPYADMSFKTFKVEYNRKEKQDSHPYPGLKKFMIERENRDIALGEGYNKRYFIEDIIQEN